MEIHFWEGSSETESLPSWEATLKALACRRERVDTYQMSLLSTRLFELGYRVFVHPDPSSGCNPYELELGENSVTDRCIRPETDLYKLWAAGEFKAPAANTMRPPSAKQLKQLRAKYPFGTRIRLTKQLDDPWTFLDSGEKAVVTDVDDMGQIHCRWDTGSTLALIPGVDEFEIVGLKVDKCFPSGVFFHPYELSPMLGIAVDIGPGDNSDWNIFGCFRTPAVSNKNRGRVLFASVTGALETAVAKANQVMGA